MTRPLHRRRSLAGFTLIELLIVILIIGILVAIGVPAYLQYQAKANDTDAKNALMVAYKAAVAGDTEVNSSRFPVASTIVNDVKQDEPTTSVARGDCAGTVANAPTKQVLVDPASTASQITLCTRSASGAIWKLSGPLTGTPTVMDGSAVPFTFSGNETTDAVRAAGVSGDGLPVDSSTGVWSSTTNVTLNGGFETNTLHWFGAQSATVTQDTTTSKFGSASAKCTTPGAVGSEGVAKNYTATDVVAAASGQAWTFSVWAKGSGTVIAVVQGIDGSGAQVESSNSPTTTLTGQWQHLTVTRTLTNAATVNVTARVITTTPQAVTFWVDGAQLEQQFVATPYVETNGATASRSQARVQAPATLLTVGQGWVAARLRMDWPASASPRGGSGWDWLFKWGAGSAPRNSIDLLMREAGGAPSPCWSYESWVAGIDTGGDCSANQTFPAGSYITLVMYWTPSTMGLSVNGQPFTIASRTSVQTASTMPATFDIGGSAGGAQIDSDIFWFATGTGTLTNADAAALNGFGNTDPRRSALPAATQATMVWDGASSSGSLK